MCPIISQAANCCSLDFLLLINLIMQGVSKSLWPYAWQKSRVSGGSHNADKSSCRCTGRDWIRYCYCVTNWFSSSSVFGWISLEVKSFCWCWSRCPFHWRTSFKRRDEVFLWNLSLSSKNGKVCFPWYNTNMTCISSLMNHFCWSIIKCLLLKLFTQRKINSF